MKLLKNIVFLLNKIKEFLRKITIEVKKCIKEHSYWVILIGGVILIWLVVICVYYNLLIIISKLPLTREKVIFLGYIMMVIVPWCFVLIAKRFINNKIVEYKPYIDLLSDIVNLLMVLCIFYKGYGLNLPGIIELLFDMKYILSLPYIVFVMKIVVKWSLIKNVDKILS